MPSIPLRKPQKPVVPKGTSPAVANESHCEPDGAVPTEQDLTSTQLNFHQRFTPHDIIIRASDGICLATTRQYLSEISGFFENLFSLPPQGFIVNGNGTAAVDIPIIDIPSTTSESLAAILEAIQTGIFRPPSTYDRNDTWSFYLDVALAIDTYDFRNISPLVIESYQRDPETTPKRKFVLAAALRQEAPADSLMDTIALLPDPQLSEKDRLLIQNLNPERLELLDMVVESKHHAWNLLKEILLEPGQHVSPKTYTFGQCAEKVCGAWIVTDGDTSMLVTLAGRGIWKDISDGDSGFYRSWELKDIRESIKKRMHCVTCSNRLGSEFWLLIEEHLGVLARESTQT